MRIIAIIIFLTSVNLLNAQKFNEQEIMQNIFIMNPDSFVKYKIYNYSKLDTGQFSEATFRESILADRKVFEFLKKEMEGDKFNEDSIVLNNFNILSRQIIRYEENDTEYIKIWYSNIDSINMVIYKGFMSKVYYSYHSAVKPCLHFYAIYNKRRNEITYTFRMLF